MVNQAVVHEQTRDYVYALKRNLLAVRIRAKRGDLKNCTLVYWNRHWPEEQKRLQMKCYARDKMYDYFETVIDTGEATRYIKYYFELSDPTATYWLNYHGINESVPQKGYFEYLYTNENDIFNVPTWVGSSIFYQILPERFFNANTANDPEKTVEWGSKPTRENFMGGDLRGIILKIEYLKNLGINAIYLNPIFKSYSNHKYDTVDYFQVDPHLGTMEDLKELVQKLHEVGIRVILDGVFNHCGFYMEQFQDVLVNNEKSRYKDWFHFESFPADADKVNYECVGYYKWMPKMKMSNPEVREFFIKTAVYWMKEANIDGWRLDVSDEVDYTFWQEFRKRIKQENPHAFLLGETWRENRDMLRGDQMDSVMNYLFRDALIDFFARGEIDSFEFDSRINKFIGVYSEQVNFMLYNLLGSHDTERFLRLCREDTDRLKLAAVFQMCFMGLPAVYYGDEIGMTGDNDPDCRRAMIWEQAGQNGDLLNWYQKLIAIRKSNTCLRDGRFKSIYCSPENSVYGFLRDDSIDQAYIVLNNSSLQAEVELPLIQEYFPDISLKELISEESFNIERVLCDGNYYNADINNYESIVKLKLKPFQAGIFLLSRKGSETNVDLPPLFTNQ